MNERIATAVPWLQYESSRYIRLRKAWAPEPGSFDQLRRVQNKPCTDFCATVCKTVRLMLSDRCLSVCNVGVLWPNGWIDQDATWYAGIGIGPGDIVLDEDTAASPRKWAQEPPTFRPMSIVAKQSAISATAELLFTTAHARNHNDRRVPITSEVSHGRAH